MTDIDAPGASEQGPGRRRRVPDTLPSGYRDVADPAGSETRADQVPSEGRYQDPFQDPSGHPGETYYEDVQPQAGYDDAPGYDGRSGYDGGEGVTRGPAHRAHSQGSRRREAPRRRRRHPVLLVLGILVVVVVVVVGGGLLWAEHQINPGGKPGAPVTVTIPQGSTTAQIGSALASAGVIHQATLFRLYVKFHNDGPLYPGVYQLRRNSSYQSAINALEAGPSVVSETLVIPEGFTIRQIASAVGALPRVGLSSAGFLAAAEGGSVRSPYEPAGVNNLEGLLFPATYQVRQGETEVDLLETMVEAFDQRAASLGLSAAAAKLHETPYQLVTVASIVEREAKLLEDRGPVASTIYNRLRIGMPLGADSTQTYFLRLTDPDVVPTAAQLDQPSPYNTRLLKGLPPTPIANSGLPSLEAAASPPSTTYLYFVEINPDGKLGFASTEAGFTQLQSECQAAGLC